jgi:aryl-alcohol dehydrogenase-like predicted oxidoreductase
VALACVLDQPLAIHDLIGPVNVAELEDCLGTLDVNLAPEALAWLNQAGAPVP